MSKQQTEVIIFSLVPASPEQVTGIDCVFGVGFLLVDHKVTNHPNGKELLDNAVAGMERDGLKAYRNTYQWNGEINIILVTDKPLADTYDIAILWDNVFDAVVGLKMLETAIGEHVYGLEYHGKN